MQAPFLLQRAKEERVIIPGNDGKVVQEWGAKVSLSANAQSPWSIEVGDLNHGAGGPCVKKHPDPSTDVWMAFLEDALPFRGSQIWQLRWQTPLDRPF